MKTWVYKILDKFLELMSKIDYVPNSNVNPTSINTTNSIASTNYPWYQIVNGNDLAQGDILLEFPVFEIPKNYLDNVDTGNVQMIINYQNLIVMTQSCDLVIRRDGKSKIDHVLLCPIYFKKDLAQHSIYSKSSEWENARQGKHLGFHVLNCCNLEDHNYDFILVDLKRNYSINFAVLADFVSRQQSRVRLLPPYREHLSQAFARSFMRVGLPVDIPKFSK